MILFNGVLDLSSHQFLLATNYYEASVAENCYVLVDRKGKIFVFVGFVSLFAS
jgi:hypothetical protein